MTYPFPILAQAVVDIPVNDTMKTLLGLIGVMVLAITVLTFWLLCKKLFGRKPPLSKELAELKKEMLGHVMHQKNSALKEMGNRHAEHQRRIEQLEEQYRQMQLDRERKWAELQKEIKELSETLSFMRGKFEKD